MSGLCVCVCVCACQHQGVLCPLDAGPGGAGGPDIGDRVLRTGLTLM